MNFYGRFTGFLMVLVKHGIKRPTPKATIELWISGVIKEIFQEVNEV